MFACSAATQELIARDDPNLKVGPNRDAYLYVASNDNLTSGAGTEIVRKPAHGQATTTAGSAAIHYMPDSGFSGTDVLSYRLKGPNGQSNIAKATIRVRLAVESVSFFHEPFPDHDVGLTVELNGSLTNGTELLEMWSDIPFVNAPRYTWILPGQSSVSFGYRLPAVNQVYEGKLFYRLNGETGSIPVRREPFDLWLHVPTPWAGQTAFGIVSALAWVRPDELYHLKSSTPLVEVPQTMDGGSQSFRIVIKEARWSFPCTIEVRRGRQYWKTTFQTIPVQIDSRWSDDLVRGGSPATLRISVNGTAGVQGLPIAIRSNSDWASVPNTATVVRGSTYVDVPVTTKPTKIERTVTVWARFKGVEHKTTLKIVP